MRINSSAPPSELPGHWGTQMGTASWGGCPQGKDVVLGVLGREGYSGQDHWLGFEG